MAWAGGARRGRTGQDVDGRADVGGRWADGMGRGRTGQDMGATRGSVDWLHRGTVLPQVLAARDDGMERRELQEYIDSIEKEIAEGKRLVGLASRI